MSKKRLFVAGLVIGCFVMGGLFWVLSSRRAFVNSKTANALKPGAKLSPADRQILQAQEIIEKTANSPSGYNQLCAAYMKKARETGDFGLNDKAEIALKLSLQLAPDNYEAVKLKAILLLTYHRFSEALETASRAQQMMPRDHDVYGAKTDALVELGDYAGATQAAQQMVDLRPDTASYARVSYLRALHGDNEGAVEAMRIAVNSASPADPESIAWCSVQLGNELMNMGDLAKAEREYDFALFTFPDYHLALAAKAGVRVARGDIDQAIDLYKRSEERVPLPDTAIALGNLYTKIGRLNEAGQQYALVEAIDRAGSALGETYSRQIALFWADHDKNLDEALAIAKRDRQVRADIYTCDELAWCLYKKGQFSAAKESVDEALRLNTKDARLFYHAGMIYKASGDSARGLKYLKLALKTNPYFDILQVEVAKKVLTEFHG